MRREGAVAWGAGAVALLAASLASALARSDDASAAYLLGRVLGLALGGLAIALLLRAGYVRLIARDRRVRSPWLLAIACAVALVTWSSAETGSERRDPPSASERAVCEANAVTAAGALDAPPRGLVTAPAPEEELAQVRATMAGLREVYGVTPRVTGRIVLRRDEPVGGVTVIHVDEPFDRKGREDFLDGVEDRAEAAGLGRGAYEEVRVGDDVGRLYRDLDAAATVVGTVGRCGMLFVNAGDERTARRVAAAIRG